MKKTSESLTERIGLNFARTNTVVKTDMPIFATTMTSRFIILYVTLDERSNVLLYGVVVIFL